jgi:hypothetical protein
MRYDTGRLDVIYTHNDQLIRRSLLRRDKDGAKEKGIKEFANARQKTP